MDIPDFRALPNLSPLHLSVSEGDEVQDTMLQPQQLWFVGMADKICACSTDANYRYIVLVVPIIQRIVFSVVYH